MLRLVTHDSWVDGARREYTLGLAAAWGLALVTWLVVRLLVDARSLLPWLAALGVLLPGDLVHYLRVAHPIARTGQSVLADDFRTTPDGPPARNRWLPELQPGASAVVDGGRLQVQAPPGVLGFIDLRLAAGIDRDALPPWLPRGLRRPPAGEVLEWEGQVQRDRDLAIVLETRWVRFEATPYGLHATYLSLDGRLDGAEIEAPGIAQGQRHRFRLEHIDAHPLQRLLVDGQVVWARPRPPGEWEFVRFGATRTGRQHGATLWIDDVRYTRLYRPGT